MKFQEGNGMIQRMIFVYPSIDALDRRLREAAAALMPVTFAGRSNLAECRDGDVVLDFSGGGDVLQKPPAGEIRCFQPLVGTQSDERLNGDRTIRFTDSKFLDQRLRGRSLVHESFPGVSAVRIERGDEVLAYCGEHPIWVVRARGSVVTDIVFAPLAKLLPGEMPLDHFRFKQFFHLLPLLHFLRDVTRHSGWESPPLRACLMLDDPNLHWTSYGFLQYGKLLERAKRQGFHVAFATVPLDAWCAHPKTVKLFRDHTEQFSLLVHGNDHSKHELSQSRPEESYLRLGAQSLRRMDRLERNTGLHVARVMAPPHGGVANNCLAALLAAGFEGVCISVGDLRRFNSGLFHSSYGLGPAAMVSGSVPVLARFKLDTSCENGIVLSAFLDRPIIPAGHHHTAAGGLELFSQTAEIINSLGDVRWESPETMLRSNFRHFREDTTLWITPYSCRIHLTVPQGITALGTCSPTSIASNGNADVGFRITRGSVERGEMKVNDMPVKVTAGDELELISLGLGKVDYREIENPESSLSLRAFPRRLLCEFRDRSMPLIPSDLIPAKWTSG